MSKLQRYPEEFRIEAVKQVTERHHSVADVAARLGVSTHSLYQWIKRYTTPEAERQADASLAAEIRRLKAELRRVTDERDILKNRPTRLPVALMNRNSGRVHWLRAESVAVSFLEA
jgi:transposase